MAFLRADRVYCLDRLGVVIRFSTDELLSLSVGWVEIRLSLAVPDFSPAFFSSLACISLIGLIYARILFDFHWVQRKL